MFKAILVIALCVGAYSVWKRPDSKGGRPEPQIGLADGGTLVVSYYDPKDLLAQLKNIKTGQKIELHCTGPSTIIGPPSGILCSDKEGVAALQAQAARESAELNHALDVEFKRIYRLR